MNVYISIWVAYRSGYSTSYSGTHTLLETPTISSPAILAKIYLFCICVRYLHISTSYHCPHNHNACKKRGATSNQSTSHIFARLYSISWRNQTHESRLHLCPQERLLNLLRQQQQYRAWMKSNKDTAYACVACGVALCIKTVSSFANHLPVSCMDICHLRWKYDINTGRVLRWYFSNLRNS